MQQFSKEKQGVHKDLLTLGLEPPPLVFHLALSPLLPPTLRLARIQLFLALSLQSNQDL